MSNKMSIRWQILYSGLAFGLIALLFGLWSHYNVTPKPKQLVLEAGTAFPIPRTISPFELQDAMSSGTLTNQSLKGHWSMLFFGFTHCAMLCPTTLATLNKTYVNLEAANVKELPQVVFISIDPERDSRQRIKEYVTSFNKHFQGATGSDDKIEAMTNELNILYSKVNPNQDDDYQIDHSGTVLLFNPEGHLAALFSPPIDAAALTKDYRAIIKNAPRN